MNNTFVKHILNMLDLSKDLFASNQHLVHETGSLNTKGAKTIEMDALMEQKLIEYVKQHNLPVKIYSEEIGVVDVHPHPEYLMCFDPLDGSTNYRVGKNLLPYGVLIAVFQGLYPRFSEVIAAGALEATLGQIFFYDGEKTFDEQHKPVVLKKNWPIDKSTPIYVDLHRRAYYDMYLNVVEKLYIRNAGSTVGNLFYTLSNVSCGMGHPRIKPEEVGAVYGLLKGAGGIVIDHTGKSFEDMLFDLDHTYQILGGAMNTIEFVATQIELSE